MKQLFTATAEALSTGRPIILVTILSSTGATPRGAGARMLVGPQGHLWGTIGGGPIEFRASQLAQALLSTGESRTQNYSLTQDDIQSLGMICGGSARVHFRYLGADALPTVQQALNLLERNEPFWLLESLDDGSTFAAVTQTTAPRWLVPLLGPAPQLPEQDGHAYFLQPITDGGRVYLFGGGHVAQALEPVLTRLEFRCHVIDDRPEFANRDCFPTAEQVLCTEFSDLSEKLSVTSQDYVCIMTRGHSHDTAIAAQMLPCHPRYLGMIGSRKKHAAVCQALRDTYGCSDDAIASIVSPIGLAIGAQTPAEIAISIAAQLIAARSAGSKHNDFFPNSIL